MDDRWVIGIISGVFMTLAGWVAKHITNSKKHPCKDDIVFRDVCDERSKRLEDCIEGTIERSEAKYQELKSDMQAGFSEIKDLIKNGR